MTRTYYRDHLDPIRDRVDLVESPPPFDRAVHPDKDAIPSSSVSERMTRVLPGIDVFLVPGHTWGQQAILFTDAQGRRIVFTPDVLPTIHHGGAAYNLAYDVEPYTSTLTRRWFLDEAMKNDWLLYLDHEPGNPFCRVRSDGKGWYNLDLRRDMSKRAKESTSSLRELSEQFAREESQIREGGGAAG